MPLQLGVKYDPIRLSYENEPVMPFQMAEIPLWDDLTSGIMNSDPWPGIDDSTSRKSSKMIRPRLFPRKSSQTRTPNPFEIQDHGWCQ